MSLYSDFLESISFYINRHAVPRFIESQGRPIENPGIVVVMNYETYLSLENELYLDSQRVVSSGCIFDFPYMISDSEVWVKGERRKLKDGEFLVVEERFFSMVCPDDIRRTE